MRFWHWLIRARHDELDARVKEAEERAASAGREARHSEERHDRIHHDVILPLKRAAEHNRFAELLRNTIVAHDDYPGRA